MVESIDKEAQKIMEKYPVFDPAEFKKVRCRLTGHELKPVCAALKDYISTRKFQRAWEVHQLIEKHPNAFEELDGGKLIGCRLTKKVLAKDAKDLERHINGRRFKRAIERGVTGDESDDDEEEMMSDMASDNDEEMDDEQSANGEESDEVLEISDDEDAMDEEGIKNKNEKAVEKAEDDFDFDDVKEQSNVKSLKRKNPGKGVAEKKKKKKTAF